MPPCEIWLMAAKDRLSRTDMGSISPSVLRSSGISAMPISGALAVRGPLMVRRTPSISTSPETPRNTQFALPLSI
jgi:hypothetical protein